jgi:hypothetical protein
MSASGILRSGNAASRMLVMIIVLAPNFAKVGAFRQASDADSGQTTALNW